MRRAHLVPILAAIFLTVCFAVASAWEIDLFFGGVDLGRHLKNGELMLSSSAPAGTASRILHTNFYSYAVGGDPFINHHWLSGVIYYLVWKGAGFAGLNAFYIFLGAVAFLLNWRIAQKAAGWAIATAVALPTMPILAVRANVRPEIFTLLFCAIFLTLLWKHYNGEVGWNALLALPLMEAAWVNLHIGFIFGPVLIGAFMLGDLAARAPELEGWEATPGREEVFRKKLHALKRWMLVLLLTSAATVLNPNGIRGAIYPFTIWSNYGMGIAENHSVLYLEANGYVGEYLAIKLTLAVLYISFLAAIVRARRFPLAMFLLGMVIGSMGFYAIRNQTLMAMFALAAIGVNARVSGLVDWSAKHRALTGAVLSLAILAGAGFNAKRAYEKRSALRLGLAKDATAAADFLRASHFPGPILNNLNIGGYLTFYLYPQYRVFVDSRPEAFPSAFLQREYLEPLTDEARWKDLLWERQFNLICFSYASTWERAFMSRRAQDQDWAVVFNEAPVLVLARRNLENQGLIRRYEIPKERVFKATDQAAQGKSK